MRRAWVLLSVLGVTACSEDAALELIITAAPQRPDSCLEVTVTRAGEDRPMATTAFPTDGGGSYAVIIYQAHDVPDDVTLGVQAWVADAGCVGRQWANGAVTVPGHFTKGLTVVEARLDALPDGDGDLTVDAVDCAPDAGEHAQSLAEQCNTRLDADCDGATACDDLDCVLEPCVAALRLLDGGALTAGECVSQTVSLFYAGAPMTPTTPVSVSLSALPDSGVSFYDAPGCAVPVSALVVGGSTASFAFKARRAGALSLTATAPTWSGATAEYAVAPGPPASVSVDAGAPSSWVATTCIGLSASWADEFGNPVVGPAMQASSAQSAVYSEASCAQSGALTLGSALYVAPTDEGEVTVSVSAGTASGSATFPVQRPFPPGAVRRWPLTIHTFQNPPFNGYDGYTVSAVFDAGVPAGELRAFFWVDAGWQELDRVASAAAVSFALQTDLGAGVDDRRYSLFAMAPSLPAAADELDGVYLFNDGFEDAALAKWRQRDGGYSRSTAQASAGTGALFFPQDTNDHDNYIEPATPLHERDVLVCSRWRADTDTGLDFAQLVRLQPDSNQGQELDRETTHWVLATVSPTGGWSGIGGNISGSISTWDEVCVAEWDTDAGTTLAGWKNGAELGRRDSTSVRAGPGSVGYRRWRTDNGGLYLDEFRARRYVEPEPTVTVQPPLTAP